jgi:hypothetical protein
MTALLLSYQPWYDAAKEQGMIQLTEEQRQALGQEQPPVAVDPKTGQEYLLIRREIYDLVKGTLKPYGRGWDNPADDDLISHLEGRIVL